MVNSFDDSIARNYDIVIFFFARWLFQRVEKLLSLHQQFLDHLIRIKFEQQKKCFIVKKRVYRKSLMLNVNRNVQKNN